MGAENEKIWFTEFGFPSINKAPNQPNVFFDPKCTNGGSPKYSSAGMDFSVQRTAIKGFIEYWQMQEYIEEMFLWTWDARPYPAYGHTVIFGAIIIYGKKDIGLTVSSELVVLPR
nr:glycoside hydrolase TIM-barrel-like domain-containing protein [Rickettsia tamurae]